MSHREILKYTAAIGFLFLLYFAYHRYMTNAGHCATGNWTSTKEQQSLAVFKDGTAILDRLNTRKGWKDSCRWTGKDGNLIVLECNQLGKEAKETHTFQCGSTNGLGYFDENIVMYSAK